MLIKNYFKVNSKGGLICQSGSQKGKRVKIVEIKNDTVYFYYLKKNGDYHFNTLSVFDLKHLSKGILTAIYDLKDYHLKCGGDWVEAMDYKAIQDLAGVFWAVDEFNKEQVMARLLELKTDYEKNHGELKLNLNRYRTGLEPLATKMKNRKPNWL